MNVPPVAQGRIGVEPMVQTTAVYERIRAARQQTYHDKLPSYPTPLVGRAVEMGTLFTWLHDPKQRLVSLVGPGGSGKTRLAVATASRHGYAFRDGVCFAPWPRRVMRHRWCRPSPPRWVCR
ncbi:MAG: hypothetical protein IPL78_28455 [Chloroflexi bacterium]|nr:hypothetical protein [Chloroflexota bacterium]